MPFVLDKIRELCMKMLSFSVLMLDLFYVCTHVIAASAQVATGTKCGFPQEQNILSRWLRIVGGRRAKYGSYPWMVSVRSKGIHFCGAAILTDRWVLSAAHCFYLLSSSDVLMTLNVVVGDHDQTAIDAEEQTFRIHTIKVHEKFHQSSPMNYDIALLLMDKKISFGPRVQPICLPLPSERIPAGTNCVVTGWGQMNEGGPSPSILQEVELELLETARCQYVLQRLMPVHRAFTVVCAGPEHGGRDACQGDSGGPLACLVADGHWVVLGVTSWGKGCGRSWTYNKGKSPAKQGSPGVFTDIQLLLPWIKTHLRHGLCSVSDGVLTSHQGVIQNPGANELNYSNNEQCSWVITVPQGHRILLEFQLFDIERHFLCFSDQLTVLAGPDQIIGRFCGCGLPSPLLLPSHSATLQFTSDISGSGKGFIVHYTAVESDAMLDSGCGTVAVLQTEGTIQTLHYPERYGNHLHCKWVIHAPDNYVVKLDFDDFDVEQTDGCVYDSLTVLADIEGSERVAVLCGTSLPAPVLSYQNLMVLQFCSDGSMTHRGFHAFISFISDEDIMEDKARKEKGMNTEAED